MGRNEVARSDPEVDEVLESAGLGHLAERFAAEDIDSTVLWMLRDGDLREMGLTLGQRKKLLERLTSGSKTPVSGTAPHAPEPELRRLTVLFSDLVGFTELTTQIDPDEMRAILQSYYAAARRAAKVFGGFIASLQGDGVIMLFGFPTTRGGSADRAVGAAHALMADLRAMSHHLSDGRDIGVAARIGIASGKAIVGYPDGATGGEPQMVGPVINRAARLQGIAGPGMVVVDEPTRVLATPAFAFARLPDAALKGFEQKVPVSEAVVPAAMASALPSVPAGNVIRSAHEKEAMVLAGALREAWGRRMVLVLLSGEAGIGKSTLLRQITAEAADGGVRVLRLVCSALSAHIPLQPVIELLEWLLGAASESAPGVRLDALRRLLAPAEAAEIRAVSALLGLARLTPGGMSTPEEDRRLLIGALTRFLVRQGTGPCLIAIEDIHWADATTREVLRACAGSALENGVMLLATSRDGEDPIWQGNARHLHLPLAPLGPEAAAKVLSHHLSGRALSEPVLQTVLTRSDGNPLMLEALARSAEGWNDAAAGQEVQVPASIYESISARLETLQVGRKAAAALSVFNAPTDPATLALSLGVGTRDLDDAVAELVDAGVCESSGAGLRFRHNLYREVCYERLVKSARERLHRAAFAALTDRVHDIGTDRPGHLAWHAFEGGDHARAAPLSLAAGEQAMQRSALTEADHFLRQALASLDRIDRTREVDKLRLRVLVAQASVSRARLGIASDEVGVLGLQVLELARGLGESRSEMIALNGLYAHALVRANYADARDWSERLSETASLSQDQTFGMIGTRGRGVVAFHTGALQQGAALLRQALDSYEETRHAPLAHVHGYDHAEICAVFLSMTLWVMGDPAGAAEISAFSVSHSRRIGHMHSLAQALSFRAMLTALAGDGAAALVSAQEAVEVAEKHGLAVMRGVGGFFGEAGRLLVRLEPPTEGDLTLLRQRHAALMQVNPWNYLPLTCTLLARLHLAGNAVGQAEDALLQAEAVQVHTGEIFVRPELMRLKAQVLAAKADPVAAQAVLLAAFRDAEGMGAWMLALRIACDLAEAAPSPRALERLRTVRGRMTSEDDGWDLTRAQTLLRSAVIT